MDSETFDEKEDSVKNITLFVNVTIAALWLLLMTGVLLRIRCRLESSAVVILSAYTIC